MLSAMKFVLRDIITLYNYTKNPIYSWSWNEIKEYFINYDIYFLCNSYFIITLISAVLCYSLFETSQSLFWASFGLVDLMAFDLTGIKGFTRFWALLMFGSYSVINIIVLLNMLIAMMSNSYQIISVSYVHTSSVN